MMMKPARIGAFEIDDAEYHMANRRGALTLTIPCKPIRIYVCNWTPADAETSVPLFSTGEHSVFVP
ncbi:DUF1480 family protein [Salmonella enterica subsp. enterica]|nr:DUF1480 family protein [Salmonella enterica subsp. enterica]